MDALEELKGGVSRAQKKQYITVLEWKRLSRLNALFHPSTIIYYLKKKKKKIFFKSLLSRSKMLFKG